VSELGPLERSRIVYRWDLDKTYLRTEFDTVRDLLRTAVESPASKRTMPGAAPLLRELRATGPRSIHILSGSPEQMRRVLEAKLRLDGITWDGFILKPSLDHILRGRFRFIRDQVGYKLRALLSSRVAGEIDGEEILFGDDAEADAFVYSLYAELLAGRVAFATLLEVLTRARVYPDTLAEILALAAKLPRRPAVRRIFVHMERVSPAWELEAYGQRVCPFYNYVQPALVLLEDGALDADAVLRVAAQLVTEQGFHADGLVASVLDLEKRGHFGAAGVAKLLAMREGFSRQGYAAAGRVLEAFLDGLAKEQIGDRRAVIPMAIDFVGLFDRDRARAKQAKRRALWRPRTL
jgi:hypothetical protein